MIETLEDFIEMCGGEEKASEFVNRWIDSDAFEYDVEPLALEEKMKEAYRDLIKETAELAILTAKALESQGPFWTMSDEGQEVKTQVRTVESKLEWIDS